MRLHPTSGFCDMSLDLRNRADKTVTPRFHRVPVYLHGRYMLGSRHEYPCQTFELSPGDAVLFAPVRPVSGERVILYLPELGRFVGNAMRTSRTGFEMSLELRVKKRERLTDQLTWFANRYALDIPDQRRHERVVPLLELAVLRAHGREHIVRVLSLSCSGVSLETDMRLAVGEYVRIGAREARIVRHFVDGFACEFLIPFRDGEIHEMTRL